ncbi:hypothetical protein LIER_31048 [Lithospermum erythrorhizon]|uniref:Uncharacterized protein n=1 Tax=Lithospermum erythrorhizon TaxID=34254 RepID=A0AAV3RTP7_LITER
MDKEHNTLDRPGISIRARSAIAPLDKRGAPIAPNKEPYNRPKLPRMEATQQARAHSDAPRPSPGMIHPGEGVAKGQGEVDCGKTKAHDDEVLLDHQSSNNNNAPPRIGGKGKHTRRLRERSLSENPHTREPNYRPGYDLTPSDSSPERSPVRENRPVHKGKVTSQSISHHRDKHTKGHRGDTRQAKVHVPPDHSTRRDAGGSSNADLQK